MRKYDLCFEGQGQEIKEIFEVLFEEVFGEFIGGFTTYATIAETHH